MSRFGRPWLRPNQVQGFVFDGATFVANFFWLDAILGAPVEEYGDRTIGILLAAGVLAQLAGVLLKRGPLQDRMREGERERSERAENVLGCLAFIHFIFFLVVAGMALALLGFVDLSGADGGREWLWFAISVGVAAATSGGAWLAIRRPAEEESLRPWSRYQELAANALLWVSATILTRFFWDALLLEAERPAYMGFTPRAIVLVLAASALFVVFYVPARLLFLAEDYKYPGTWLRLWLVAMLPLLTIVFLPE